MKDWLNDIHDKLGDFETKAPEGLWAKLEASQAVPAGKAGSSVHDDHAGKMAPLLLWGRRFAAVGAAAALLFAGVLLFRNDPSADMVDIVADVQEGSAQTGGEILAENAIADSEVGITASNDHNASAQNGLRTAKDTGRIAANGAIETMDIPGLEATPMDDECQTDMSVESKMADETAANSKLVDETGLVSKQADGKTENYKQSESNRKTEADTASPKHGSDRERMRRGRGEVSIGIINSLGTQSSSTLAFAGPSMTVAGPDENAVWDDSPMLGAMLFSRGVGEAKFTHRMPVRVGVTLDWQLAQRWFIESGLTYTRLNSSIRQGDDENYTSASQKLDYIGIPLNLKFKAYGTPRFGLYASAGMNLDKCVSASRRGSYRFAGIGGPESGELGIEKYDERPLQLSANLAAGVAYIISPLMSIYAEPGISYYFDDKSSLDTIYKERPLNFSMNLGLRFTLIRGR